MSRLIIRAKNQSKVSILEGAGPYPDNRETHQNHRNPKKNAGGGKRCPSGQRGLSGVWRLERCSGGQTGVWAARERCLSGEREMSVCREDVCLSVGWPGGRAAGVCGGRDDVCLARERCLCGGRYSSQNIGFFQYFLMILSQILSS